MIEITFFLLISAIATILVCAALYRDRQERNRLRVLCEVCGTENEGWGFSRPCKRCNAWLPVVKP